MNSVLETATIVAEILERLGVPYFIAGSFASSAHGEPRATQDIDFVVALTPEQVLTLVAALEADFYVDRLAIYQAIAEEGSLNLIRWATMDKVDVFVRKMAGWAKEEFERRRPVTFALAGRTVTLYLASPEDTLLHKLVRFQQGSGVSERQWLDILGILRVQGATLDKAYLLEKAEELGVVHLLHRALAQAQRDLPTCRFADCQMPKEE